MKKCTDQLMTNRLLAYEIGMLTDKERQEFELHLLNCSACFEQVKEFKSMSQALRSNPEARELISQVVKAEAKPNLIREEDRKDRLSSDNNWFTYGRYLLVAAVAILLFIFTPWEIQFSPTQEAQAAPNRLLILNFDDHLGMTGMGEIVGQLLITDLTESDYLQVVSAKRLFEIQARIEQEGRPTDSSAYLALLAKYSEARWILSGSVLQDQNALALTSRLVDLNQPEQVKTERVVGKLDEPLFGLVDQLTVKIKSDLPLPAVAMNETDRKVADLTTHSPEAYAFYIEGLSLAQKLYIPEAVVSFEACLAIDSTFALAYYQLARLKDYRLIELAVRYLDRTSKKDQLLIRSRESEYLNGCQGHPAILAELLERYPGETEAILHQGYHAKISGDIDKAIQLWQSVLAIDPLSKQAYNYLAYGYDDNGEFERALEAINNYIRIAPDEPNPYDSKGDLYTRHGDLDKAKSSYQTALEKRSDFWSSQFKLGYLHIYEGDYTRAEELISIFDTTQNQFDQLSADQFRAMSLMRQGRLAEALIMIERVIASYQELVQSQAIEMPTTPYHIKALIYHEQGEYAQAVAAATNCVSLTDEYNPNNAMNYRWVQAHYLAELGDDRRVDSLLARLSDYYDDKGTTRSQLFRAAGVVALARHNYEQAAELLLKAIGKRSLVDDYLTHARLGQAYLGAGRYDEAITILKGVTSVLLEWRLIDGVYGVKSHYHLGLAYEAVGELALAKEQYRLFLNIWKDADPDLIVISEAKEQLARLENGS